MVQRILLLIGIIASIGLAQPARAEQGIGISPTHQTVTLAPDGSTRGSITVINDGDSSVKYQIYATDYRVTGEQYTGVFTNEGAGPNLSARTWFGLPSGTFTVAARQQATFDYTLTAPKTAAVGGHYATVFVQTVPPPATGGTLISRVERIGSIFYLTVSGDLKQTGKSQPLTGPQLQFAPPVRADLRVSNTGNVHFLVSGTAQLATPFGKVGSPVAFEGEVLPSTTRLFGLSLPTGHSIGLYQMNVSVDYLGRTEHLSRWVLLVPRLTLVIVAATIVLLVALGVWALARRWRRRGLQPKPSGRRS